jgi:DNA-binding MarR family transcriptional regulator
VNAKNLDFSQFADCACFNLRKASRAVTQYYDHALQSLELRATQFTILASLANFGTVTISAFAAHLVMDRTTLTRNLRPLQNRDLVEVVPGVDQRQRFLELTPKGRELLLKAMPVWQQAQAAIEEQLDDKFAELLDTTKKIVSITT